MLQGASRALKQGGLLLVYGPFKVDGAFTTASNEAFHGQLKAMDPAYGLRDMQAEVFAPAAALGLAARPPVGMPANNFLLALERT